MPQRLLLGEHRTKDPKASDIMYVKALASPFTVNTMPEATLKAFADHGEVGEPVPMDGGDCEKVLADFGKAGIDIDALAAKLQDEGAKSFVNSWNELLGGHRIQERGAQESELSMAAVQPVTARSCLESARSPLSRYQWRASAQAVCR